MNTITRMIDGGTIHRRQLIKSTRYNQKSSLYNWTQHHRATPAAKPDYFNMALASLTAFISKVLPS